MKKLALCFCLMLAPGAVFASDAPALEHLRQTGDAGAERRHLWALIARITADKNGQPLFQSWHGEGALFSPTPPPRPGLAGFSRSGMAAPGPTASGTGAPVLTYTLYNGPAYDHIIRFSLNRAATLERLRLSGDADDKISGDRDVPAFPADAIVLKTAWWPVAKTGVTALPVWDPAQNPPSPRGNPYTSWSRVVAVDARPTPSSRANMAIDFAGRHFADARLVGMSAFYHVTVDGVTARAMMADPESRKAALIALGRPLAAGDSLILVGANLAAREIPDWIWGTFWWHDRPGEGAFAKDRPQLAAPWSNYLMAAAFDAQKPEAADGGPHIAFDPWLEGRFPDGGHGGGSASNCMACHARASYPALSFLPVTRGLGSGSDPAYAPGRLRTSLLWSLALHAKSH